jgi:hypothetical protein
MCKKYLLSGVCCALLSWSGIIMVEKVESMEIEDRGEISKFEEPSSDTLFCQITIDFPCFLGSGGAPIPSHWPRALAYAARDVAALHKEQYVNKLPCAFTAINYLTALDFANVVAFCESDSCDTNSRGTLLSLFSLVPKILHTLQPYKGKKRLTNDFRRFLDNVQSTRPLVSISDEALFRRVSKMIRELSKEYTQ